HAHAIQTLQVKLPDVVDAAVDVRNHVLVAAEPELDATDAVDLVERLEIAPEAAEEGDALRRLMRRRLRQHVVAGEEHVVDEKTDLARAMSGRVEDLVAV